MAGDEVDAAPWLLCPITQELMRDPVIGSDGYTYERAAIMAWLAQHAHSPMTRQTMSAAELRPNRAVADQTEWLLRRQTGKGREPGVGFEEPSAPPLPNDEELQNYSVTGSTAYTPSGLAAATVACPASSASTSSRYGYDNLDPQLRQPHPARPPSPLQEARQKHKARKRKGKEGKLVAGKVYGDKVQVTGVYQDRLREKDCVIM